MSSTHPSLGVVGAGLGGCKARGGQPLVAKRSQKSQNKSARQVGWES